MGEIIFSQVSKAYQKKVISNASFKLESGGFHFLIGQSGCGKTTILKLIHLLEVPDHGQIEIDGVKIGKRTNLVKHRTQIGFVFQDYRLIEKQSAAFNIKLPLYIAGLKKARCQELFDKTISKLGISHLLDKPIESLSGGEKQLVSIARAIITEPKILLVDEPSAHLDRRNSLKILNVLLTIRNLGVTLILATHDIGLIKATEGVKIILMKNGKLQFKNN